MKKELLLILAMSISLVGCENDRTKPNPDKIGTIDTDRTRDVDHTERNVRDRDFDRTRDVDNTGRNVRDRDSDRLTPENQSETKADRMITQAIRQSIISADDLSGNAKNIKIITIDGRVTLRGVVENNQEKNIIDRKAKSIQDVKEVNNQLEVIR